MRITPLVCWQCKSWFIPKTKRPSKFCCGACRQQNYLANKAGRSSGNPVRFKGKDQAETSVIRSAMKNYCNDGHENCIECMFEEDFEAYSGLVYQCGIDKYNMSAKDWLKERNML